jgi:hypothetical protein
MFISMIFKFEALCVLSQYTQKKNIFLSAQRATEKFVLDWLSGFNYAHTHFKFQIDVPLSTIEVKKMH